MPFEPYRSADVAQYQEGFWATMSNGTGVSYDSAGDSQPTIWGMETCVEADSQFFYRCGRKAASAAGVRPGWHSVPHLGPCTSY